MYKYTPEEQFYLKRMAALQFPNSIDNYSTRHPIHFIEELSDNTCQKDINDYPYEDNIAYIVSNNGITYNSIEELVADHLDISLNDLEIENYNCAARQSNEPEFITLEESLKNFEIPGSDECIFTARDYLQAYGIDEDVDVYCYTGDFIVEGVSFTHKGVLEVKDKIQNHLFRNTRTYAFTTTDGDFPVLMKMLYKMGEMMLREETANDIIDVNSIPYSEITEHYKAHPNEQLLIATVTVRSNKGDATINVYTSGEIITHDDLSYPVRKTRMIFSCGNETKELPYPFDADTEYEHLTSKDSVWRLVQYARYK